MDYGSELETDLEYAEDLGVKHDLGIVLRMIPSVLYGSGGAATSDEVTLLGIPIDNMTMDEAVEDILERMDGEKPHRVCFVNADCANLAFRNATYLDALQRADLCLADGIGMKLAGKMLGREIRQNVNGTDLFPRLCTAMENTGKGIYLLGARPGVVEDVAEWIRRNAPGADVRGLQHGYFKPEEEADVIARIRDSGARVLLVAFGAPKQDLWVREHLEESGVKVAMGVGGLFDFYSGRMPRAPQWMRDSGLEWLYRLIKEPGRMWKRYLVGNGVFLFRTLREKILQ